MAETPLNDFLARLADPTDRAEFLKNPKDFCAKHNLSAEFTQAVLQMRGGILRVLAIQELERAGMAPTLSDKFLRRTITDRKIGTIRADGDDDPTYPETNTDVTITIDPPNTVTDPPQVAVTLNYNNWPPDTTSINYTESITHAHILSEEEISRSATAQRTISTKNKIASQIDGAISASETTTFNPKGRLMVVGSGIRSIVDLTLGAEAQIRLADQVFYTVADPVTERRIHALNPNSRSLYDLYGNDKPRIETYREMVRVMLAEVHAGKNVCAVFYGHPGVFAWPTHESIRQARTEGYQAEMMPGISADACLFADLGIDPSQAGYQTFEATELLVNKRQLDPCSHVVIWQVECVGDGGFNFTGYKRHNFGTLREYLLEFYESSATVIVYEASMYSHLPSTIKKTTIGALKKEDLTGISTLYIPPARDVVADLDMARKLGVLKIPEAAIDTKLAS